MPIRSNLPSILVAGTQSKPNREYENCLDEEDEDGTHTQIKKVLKCVE